MFVKNFTLILFSALVLSACGNEGAPASVAVPPSSPVATSDAHTHTPASATTTTASAPLAKPSAEAGNSCQIELGSNDAMQFSTKTISIPKHCESASIRLSHNGKLPIAAMGHNVVITAQTQLNNVLSDALKAGKEQGYLKPNDERVLAHTKMLGGGESDTLHLDAKQLKALQDEPHVFVCTFPGHSGPMRGTIEVK